MKQCKAEPCVFRKRASDEISLTVGVHVDDIIVSDDHDVCDQVFKQLRERFPVKDQGDLKIYTGCAFVRD